MYIKDPTLRKQMSGLTSNIDQPEDVMLAFTLALLSLVGHRYVNGTSPTYLATWTALTFEP